MNYISFNGKLLPAVEPALLVANRSYRYGDGLFETMKVEYGKIHLEAMHFERLFAGLSLLRMEIPRLFTAVKLKKDILGLCKRNECWDLGRVRLSVFRGNGGLYDADDDTGVQYLVECWPLAEAVNQLNENGLVIGVYPDVRKSCDKFSNLKSANFLPYTMAALYAKEHKLNDCLVMNTYDNIADSTIANVFIIKDKTIITPGLNEGCVNGVMRRKILDCRSQFADLDLQIEESVINEASLKGADEIFLSNAINGIRWVKQLGEKNYSKVFTSEIYNVVVTANCR